MRGYEKKSTVRLSPRHRGLRLGDKFAKVAKPVARGIDHVFGTNIHGCVGCDHRQDWLNRLFTKTKETA